MRWDDGVTLRPISGWEQIVYPTPFASRVRAIHRWMTKAGIFYLAYLCESHCYIDTGGSLFDATPTGGMATAPPLVAGYGELDFGEETYGTPRTGISTLTKFSPAWSINNWGENLVFMSSYDGRLLQWVALTPTVKAVVVTGAPTNNRQFVVTPQRHLMLFGMGGQQADFGWCSEENINDWNFASTTNTAGKYTADPFAPIVAAHSSSVGISVHTPAMTHFVDYIGLPYVYRTRPIGRVPIPISAASMSSIPEGIVWISIEGFWMYNGSTADTIPCPVWDVIAENMDFERTVRESHSVNLLARGEIWWFWVPKGSLEPTRYAALDYRGKIWMSGYLHRTSGNTYANDRYPIMSDGFKVWKHETGFQYPGAPYLPFLESQVINLEGGDAWNTISKIMPDVAGDKTALAFRLAMSNNRSNYATGEKLSPQRTINEHGWVDIRETARDVRLRIEMIKNNDWSTIGPIIFDIKQRGRR